MIELILGSIDFNCRPSCTKEESGVLDKCVWDVHVDHFGNESSPPHFVVRPFEIEERHKCCQPLIPFCLDLVCGCLY